jgi:hypothetical protein
MFFESNLASANFKLASMDCVDKDMLLTANISGADFSNVRRLSEHTRERLIERGAVGISTQQ